jgi:hypothetical protein
MRNVKILGPTPALIPAGEAFDFVVSVVASDAAAKLLWVDQVGELGENDFCSVHPGSLAKSLLDANRTKLSNRSHPIPRTKTLSTLRETGARSFNTRTVVPETRPRRSCQKLSSPLKPRSPAALKPGENRRMAGQGTQFGDGSKSQTRDAKPSRRTMSKF